MSARRRASKGGMVAAIQQEPGRPIKFILQFSSVSICVHLW